MEQDKKILRELASRYMEFASLPKEKEKVSLWKSLNASRMQRPMVTIDQLPWNELNEDGFLDLQCTDPFLREIECRLRRQILQAVYFPVDAVVEPIFPIYKAIHSGGYGLDPQREALGTDATNDVVSQVYIPQVSSIEDLSKIQDMQFSEDKAESARREALCHDIFDGIMPIRMAGVGPFHLGFWDYLTTIFSPENIYFALLDEPEFMHAAARRTTDSLLAGIKSANDLLINDDFANICHCNHIYTDELLIEPGKNLGTSPGHTKNCWAFGLAQLFTAVSPAVTREFELPYIQELASSFGMIYYGCCDRLDDRLDVIKEIPNVKKISCSPWSNREHFAQNIGNKLIMSYKPNPAFLADSTFQEDAVRQDLAGVVALAKAHNVQLEILLKDVSTVRYERARLTRWYEIAMEEVSR